ncbi:hypothetical protein RclHR1_09050013 [Rhizophagus clarus]|uniref:Uncharacterized protein n=1 Tax=Rhizophagus clarus TaxID=94130 RepID=A0A2Z6S983_9GLOM|nr:hypothetical protein RclHR1_09050013 [Rhizophagus clarus]GES92931.1 hypothetical protein RCL_jg28218.t1 [Rhizophagus clarus]
MQYTVCGHPNHKFAKCPDKDNIKLFCRPRASNIEPKDLKPRSYLTTNIKNSVNYHNRMLVSIQQNDPTIRQRSQSREAIHNLSHNNIEQSHTYHQNRTPTQEKNNQYLLEYPNEDMINEITNRKLTKQNNIHLDSHIQCASRVIPEVKNIDVDKGNASVSKHQQTHSKIFNEDIPSVAGTDNDPTTNQSYFNQ